MLSVRADRVYLANLAGTASLLCRDVAVTLEWLCTFQYYRICGVGSYNGGCCVNRHISPWMTKRFGGSTAGIWGSVVGLFVGMFLPWPVGPLMGPFLGAFAGEMLVSKKDSGSAMHAALGSFLSFFVGTGLKLLICVGMLLAAIYSM